MNVRGFFRRRWPWIAALPVVGAIALFAYSFHLTSTDAYRSIPAEAWGLRSLDDARRLASAPDAVRNRYDSGVDWGRTIVDSERRISPAVEHAAARWVDEINAHNPDAILYHEMTSMGHLMVVFGAWWGEFDAEHQMNVLDELGLGWQDYMAATFGEWDGSEGFTPGIVAFDPQGEVARNINGEIRILRPPTY